ncbi:RpiB/LacA/LacB family sugar-phosphate isomerase [Candidatus Dependentiae bacterium]
MVIAIGADHRGFEHKKFIMEHRLRLTGELVDWLDVGCFSSERCDYPEFAKLVAKSILEKKADLGVLICGSGIGMSITANRFKYIYAGLCWNVEVAKAAREDDNINILVLPSNFVEPARSIEIINAWLDAKFKFGRYQERLAMIDD